MSLSVLLLLAGCFGFVCFSMGFRMGAATHSDYSIYPQHTVPVWQEQTPDRTGRNGADSSVYPININFANAETLQLLPDIGPERAEAIIAYREEHGIFVTKEELMDVPGIGQDILAEIEDLIYIDYRE